MYILDCIIYVYAILYVCIYRTLIMTHEFNNEYFIMKKED